MTETVRLSHQLTERERERLFGWGEHIFGVEDLKFSWRPKDLHFILDLDGDPVSHVGLLDHTIKVAGQPIRVGGVGAVVTAGDMHGRGYSQRTLRRAEQYLAEDMKVEFGLLFCLDRLAPFYARQGWKPLEEPVEFDQPSGRIISPFNVMVLPFDGRQWPEGATDLCSLPW